MTSKQALEKLCNDCNNKMGENYTHCLHRRVCGIHCDEYEQIKKDLKCGETCKEMLNIILQSFKVSIDRFKNAFKNEREFEMFKEWLDGKQ